MVLKCTFELTKAINILVRLHILPKPESQRPFTNRVEEVGHVHKPAPVGRLMISGCGGLSEKQSSFIDKPLQQTKVPQDKIVVLMDSTSLYTNIPQEERIHILCRSYNAFYKTTTPL